MDEFQGPFNPFAAFAARNTPHKGAVGNVAGHRKVGEEVCLLENVADAPLPGGQCANLAAREADCAAVKGQEARGGAQEARFTATGGPGKDKGFAGGDRKGGIEGKVGPIELDAVKFEGQGGPPWAGTAKRRRRGRRGP